MLMARDKSGASDDNLGHIDPLGILEIIGDFYLQLRRTSLYFIPTCVLSLEFMISDKFSFFFSMKHYQIFSVQEMILTTIVAFGDSYGFKFLNCFVEII